MPAAVQRKFATANCIVVVIFLGCAHVGEIGKIDGIVVVITERHHTLHYFPILARVGMCSHPAVWFLVDQHAYFWKEQFPVAGSEIVASRYLCWASLCSLLPAAASLAFFSRTWCTNPDASACGRSFSSSRSLSKTTRKILVGEVTSTCTCMYDR